MKLGVKQQIIIAVVLAIILTAGFLFLLELPKIRQLSELETKRSQKEQEIKTTQAELDRLEAQLKELPKMKEEVETLKQKMPAEANLPTIIRDIQTMSDQAGVDFLSIKPSAPTQQSGYGEVPLEVTINGVFFDLVDFLYRVQTLSREVKVTSVSVEAGEAGLPNIKVTIKLSTFVYGTVPQVGQTTGGTTGGTTGKSSTGSSTQQNQSSNP